MDVPTLAQMTAEGKKPEILFWVGCAGSFDDRAKKISKSFVKILQKASISFAVLGTEESCTGDPAKRAGNEFLFQMQAMINIEILNAYNIKRIVTTCPHDYNTIKNEYKSLGGTYEVLHHTEFITELVNNSKISIDINMQGIKATYHDPCYLGRSNGIFEEPRNLIKKTGLDLVEMVRSKKRSFCCGAGGAQMFKEPEKGIEDININRTNEALGTGAKVIITSCPFCNTMMTDGVKNLSEGSSDVLDIVEILKIKNVC